MGMDLEQNRGFLVCLWFVSEDGDIAVGVEAVDHTGAGRDGHPQTFVADGHATIWPDLQSGARTPDVRPPCATGCRTQDGAIFPTGFLRGRLGSAAQFAMDFLGVAMATQFGQEGVGRFRGADVFGSEQGGKPSLPVLMLAFDFAFGLGSAGVAQGDAVEVQRGSELGQRLGSLWEEKAMAIHIEFERQAMFGESGGQKVEVGQQVFGVINLSAGADAGTVIQQIEQRIVSLVTWEPTVRCGIQLPECADLEALPAPHRSGRAAWGNGVSQIVGDGPPANGGRIDLKA